MLMSQTVGAYSVEEHSVRGETLWIAIRVNGGEKFPKIVGQKFPTLF